MTQSKADGANSPYSVNHVVADGGGAGAPERSTRAPKRPHRAVDRVYDPGVKTQYPDPIAAVVHGGLEPDAVFARVRFDDSPTFVGIKTSDRPIDYLLRRNSNKIDPLQYAAAEQFLAAHEVLGRAGSTTEGVIRSLQTSHTLTRDERIEIRERQGKPYMHVGSDVRPRNNQDEALMMAAALYRKLRYKIDRFDYSILYDLIVREYPVGVIAQRIGMSPDAVGGLIRVALWRLVTALETASAEFRAVVAAERTREADGG